MKDRGRVLHVDDGLLTLIFGMVNRSQRLSVTLTFLHRAEE